jgi:hypothetical protein
VLEAFGGVVGVLVMASLFAAVTAFEVFRRRRATAVLAEVAPSLGLSTHGDGLRQQMRGVIDGVTVEVGTLTLALGAQRGQYTRFRLTVITRDEAFDATIRVEGERGLMLAHLSAPARAAIVAAAPYGWKLIDGVWEALEPGRPSSAARVREVLQAGVAAARAAQRSGTIREALAERAKADPVEAIRRAAQEELGGWGGAPEVVEPVTADQALQALRDPARAFEAALLLAEAGDDRSEVRMALIGALPDSARIARAIEGLSKVGGKVEAMALRAVSGEHAEAAQRAIEAIEARG